MDSVTVAAELLGRMLAVGGPEALAERTPLELVAVVLRALAAHPARVERTQVGLVGQALAELGAVEAQPAGRRQGARRVVPLEGPGAPGLRRTVATGVGMAPRLAMMA